MKISKQQSVTEIDQPPKLKLHHIPRLLVMVATLSVCSTAPASAQTFIVGPGTVSTTLGDTDGAITNLSNQSGLGSSYTPGVTNFTTFTTTVTHNSNPPANSWRGNTAALGFITFDLGSPTFTSAIAVWQGDNQTTGQPASQTTQVNLVELFSDTDALTGNGGLVSLGTFNLTADTNDNGINADVFTYASPVTSQFFHLQLQSVYNPGLRPSLGEVAFAVPEPHTWLGTLAAIGLGCGCWFKSARRQKSSKN